MVKTKVNLVSGNKQTLEFNIWSDWMRKAAKLVNRHIAMWSEDDPFAYNETASVGLLAAAGALAGHVTLAECKTQKRALDAADPTKISKRKRHGRADLWLHTSNKKWAFEFKQRLSVGVSKAEGRLSSKMKEAEDCARLVIKKDDGYPVAALIVSLYFVEDDAVAKEAGKEIRRYALSKAAYCWRLLPPAGRRPTYFLFNPIQ